MKINNLVVCEAIQQQSDAQDNSTVTVLQKPLPSIDLPFIPALYSFALSFGLYDFHNKDIQIHVELKSPDGQVAMTVDYQIPVGSIDPKVRSITGCVDCRNVRLNIPGEYCLTVQADDVSKTETILVRKADA